MNTQPNHSDHKAKILAWLFFNQEMVKIIPEKIRAEMSQFVEQQAKSTAAKSRITNLAPSANRQQSPEVKNAVKIVVAAMSAIAFSAGAQILTSRLGYLSIPSALGVGSIAGILADTKATEVITRKRRQQSTQQALIAIEEQQQASPPVNELGKLFNQTQTALVLQVEGSNLEKQPMLDLVLATGLSGAEYVISLSIVTSLGLPGGILLNAIAASLPLVMLWTGASIQSKCFEMPEHDRELIDQYEKNISEELTEEQQQRLALIDEEINLAEQEIEYNIALEKHRLKFITEGNPRLKNWQMAEADSIGGEEGETNYLSQLTDQTLTGLDQLIAQEDEETTQQIGRRLWQYIEEDLEEKMRNCHPRNHLEANCQELARRLLLKYPEDKLTDIARDLNVNYQTLNSHWKRSCLPHLQEIAKKFEYKQEQEL